MKNPMSAHETGNDWEVSVSEAGEPEGEQEAPQLQFITTRSFEINCPQTDVF